MKQEADELKHLDTSAEDCLLASLILCGTDEAARFEVFAEVRASVTGQAFMESGRAVLFSTIMEMDSLGERIDAVTLRSRLIAANQWDGERGIGGSAYLATLLNLIPSWHHWRTYLEIVRRNMMARQIHDACGAAIKRIYEPRAAEDIGDIGQQLSQRVARILTSNEQRRVHSIGEILISASESLEEKSTALVPTGFRALDRAIGGIDAGEMALLAARPSMGKSTFVRQMALNLGRANVPVGLISLEEGRQKVGRNWLSNEAQIDNHELRRPPLADRHWLGVRRATAELSALPVYVADRVSRLDDVKALATLLVAKYGCKLLMLDHLQRIHAPGRDRYQQMTTASGELSALFKALHVAGLVCSQLNRNLEYRSEKAPTISDLRESGALEQDADLILFLHREDYYHLDDNGYAPTNKAEILIAKARDGVRGTSVPLKTCLRFQRFEDWPEIDPFATEAA